MTKVRSKDYTPTEYDFTDDDVYLLKHTTENPKETAKSLELFRKLTGSTLNAPNADIILDALVESGSFEKFTVHLGYRTETIWRSLNPIELEPVEVEEPKAVEPEYIKLTAFSDHLLDTVPEINHCKTVDDFLGKLSWLAAHRLTDGFNKASRKANHEIRTDVLENLLMETIKSTRGLDKQEWLAKVDPIMEGFDGK